MQGPHELTRIKIPESRWGTLEIEKLLTKNGLVTFIDDRNDSELLLLEVAVLVGSYVTVF
jgi:hypothetical protein